MRIVAFLLALAACGAPAPADDRHVILVTLDGFPAYLLTDPKAPVPTLRKLASQGASAAGMRVSNPSITWPNHTTLITGVNASKHSVLFNGIVERDRSGKYLKVDPARDQSDLVAVPTLYDVAHKAGLTTADINWPCTRNSPSIDDSFPDVPAQIDFMTPRLKSELREHGILSVDTQAGWLKLGPAQWDDAWTGAACYVIRQRKPNFLTLHIGPDAIHHKYGPQTMAGYAAAAIADHDVRDVLKAIDDAGIREQTTLIITADHGFDSAKKIVEPNVILRKAGLLTASPTGGIAGDVQIISEGGSAFVYFSDANSASQYRDKVISLFKGHEGIADVILPDRYAALGLPTPEQNPHIGELLITPTEGYAFGAVATGEDDIRPAVIGVNMVGYHGYLNDNSKMNALFIAVGRRIARGKTVGLFDNTAVAPTIADLLGLQMKCDGRVLTEILQN